MSYDLKNVFYLGNNHVYGNASASKEWIAPIDVSAFVDPISKGRARGQGLAVYKVHGAWQKADGSPPLVTETCQFTMGLSVKPYTTTGDELTGETAYGDLKASSDLLIFGQTFQGGTAGGALVGDSGPGVPFLTPSEKVPYVVVRDTIFQIATTGYASAADVENSIRMECAMITLDTATLNQLLRTQTA